MSAGGYLATHLSNIVGQGVEAGDFVCNGVFYVEVLYVVVVLRKAMERYDHILVELEGAGMASDGCHAAPVRPEAGTLLLGYGYKPLAVTLLRDGTDGSCRLINLTLIITADIDEKHHTRLLPSRRFVAILNRLNVPLIKMFKPFKMDFSKGIHLLLDCHHCLGGPAQLVTEELAADGTLMGEGGMEDKGGARYQPVGPLLLNTGEPSEGLAGHILPQAVTAEEGCVHIKEFRLAQGCPPVCLKAAQPEGDRSVCRDPAEVVVEPLDEEPVAIGGDHPP